MLRTPHESGEGSVGVYVHVADVGDGFCMAIRAGSTVLQVDRGTTQGDPDVALRCLMRTVRRHGGPELSVITHFCADHYTR